ncbi:MAG: hypothetical protein V1725_02985 [archaeon]
MRIHLAKLLRNGRAFWLAADAGSRDVSQTFDLKTIEPKFLLDLALEGSYTGIVLNPGIAEKYHHTYFKDVSLIVALNQGEWHLASVERALKLGAHGVLYDFGMIPAQCQFLASVVEKAHDYGLPVIAKMQPSLSTDGMAKSARFALELGVDVVVLPHHYDSKGFEWVAKSAGVVKIVVEAQGAPRDLARAAHEAMAAGAAGIVVGKQAWQHEQPFVFSKALRRIVLERIDVDEALKGNI